MDDVVVSDEVLAAIIQVFEEKKGFLRLLYNVDYHCPIGELAELVLRFKMTKELFSEIANKLSDIDLEKFHESCPKEKGD